MKLFSLITLFAILSFNGFSQCSIIDNSIENWDTKTDTTTLGIPYTYDTPHETWFSFLDAFSAGFTGQTQLTKSTDKNTGTYAAKLTPSQAGNDADLMGVGACTTRHAKLTGYYKFTGQGTDSLTIAGYLVKGNSFEFIFGGSPSNVIAECITTITAPATNYTKFSINFNYQSTQNPDSFAIIIFTSRHSASVIYSLIDDIAFEGTVSGIQEAIAAENPISVYPIPAHRIVNLHLQNKMNGANLIFTDMTGRVLFAKNNISSTEQINVSGFEKGVYFLTITRDDKTYTQKIVVD